MINHVKLVGVTSVFALAGTSIAVGITAAAAQPSGTGVTVLWDRDSDSSIVWAGDVTDALVAALPSEVEVGVQSYQSGEPITGLNGKIAVSNEPLDAVDHDAAALINMGALPDQLACAGNTLHFAADASVPAAAAALFTQARTARLFGYFSSSGEGVAAEAAFREAWGGGFGGDASFAPDHLSFRNEVDLLSVTNADGAVIGLEGAAQALFFETLASTDRFNDQLVVASIVPIELSALSAEAIAFLERVTVFSPAAPLDRVAAAVAAISSLADVDYDVSALSAIDTAQGSLPVGQGGVVPKIMWAHSPTQVASSGTQVTASAPVDCP